MNGVSKERKYYTGHVPLGYGSGTTTFVYLSDSIRRNN